MYYHYVNRFWSKRKLKKVLYSCFSKQLVLFLQTPNTLKKNALIKKFRGHFFGLEKLLKRSNNKLASSVHLVLFFGAVRLIGRFATAIVDELRFAVAFSGES